MQVLPVVQVEPMLVLPVVIFRVGYLARKLNVQPGSEMFACFDAVLVLVLLIRNRPQSKTREITEKIRSGIRLL
jgi:hypothetical protein